MIDGKVFIGLDKVERQTIVDVDRGKWPHPCFRPLHPEQFGQELGRSNLVAGWHDGVIEMDGHRRPPYLGRKKGSF
ncbi:hypothetical protein D9M69_690050 [compost metagenome]